ncbi:hypothetical protein QBC34DRAFT_379921 [Podospora aff. communis PSN243]|uniref:Uncharacterized protein n=1 Tax=Podospora aff. communis PSN243 TaxID=3040156 RepID=A0AAV9GPH9_9PEZI|nr:hypothetical protein QBC34DRAFT_379921 [Podospora aff. communis PSN243]
MSSQRPFFLSTFFAAFRQQPPSLSASTSPPQHTHQHKPTTTTTTVVATPRNITTSTGSAASSTSPAGAPSRSGVISQLPIHSPRSHHHGGIPIPQPGRRRGSDSSSEGFREVLGADKLYIGGRTATGEEKFFKLGVVRRVRSGDRLSLDRLSL